MRLNRLILVVFAAAIASAAVVVPFAIWQRETHEVQPVSIAPIALEQPAATTGESALASESESEAEDDAELAAALQSVEIKPRPMTMLPGGLVIGTAAPGGWSHLVLHSVPRVAEGDVDRVSGLVNKLAGLFHLVVVANIVDTTDANSDRIQEVAIGLATSIQGVETTVSSQSPGDVKPRLDFMERTALGQNEATLKTAQQVARTKTMFVFDSETIMWRDNDHLRTIFRHAILVAPENGRVATLVWALAPIAKGRFRFCGDSLELLPNGLREDRLLHVDASKFSLGIPTQQSFALIRLPPGKTVVLSPARYEVAESRFDLPEDALRLEAALRQAIGWDRSDDRVSSKFNR